MAHYFHDLNKIGKHQEFQNLKRGSVTDTNNTEILGPTRLEEMTGALMASAIAEKKKEKRDFDEEARKLADRYKSEDDRRKLVLVLKEYLATPEGQKYKSPAPTVAPGKAQKSSKLNLLGPKQNKGNGTKTVTQLEALKDTLGIRGSDGNWFFEVPDAGGKYRSVPLVTSP